MSNFVNGEVRISEPASLVSIALGGVFGESGGGSLYRKSALIKPESKNIKEQKRVNA